MGTYENEEIVWLPKELAKKVNDFKKEGLPYENLVTSYLDQSKAEVKANLESLDEEVLQYKGLMIKAKNAFKEAKEEQLAQSYEIWENFDKELKSVRSKVQETKDSIIPIKNELEEIKRLMSEVQTWDIEKLLDTLKTISDYLTYNGDTAKILKFLFDNYKKG